MVHAIKSPQHAGLREKFLSYMTPKTPTFLCQYSLAHMARYYDANQVRNLKDDALRLLSLGWSGSRVENGTTSSLVSKSFLVPKLDLEFIPNGLVKDALEIALGQCRALQVLVSADLFGTD